MGQAVANHMHSTNGTTFLQDISYKFNERGWLTKASAPLLAEQLKYTDGTTPQYNGNIANQLWGKANSLSNTYTYSYDKTNRLTSGSSATMAETGISYDLMGNIQSLTRDGHAISYTYDSSKQLTSVSGTGLQSGTYSYDGNGNVLNDGSNGFSFTNNLYNLPRQATDGTQTISYTYDAAGNKLSKSNTLSGLTEYVNGIQYDSNTGSYGIDFIPVAGGRAERKTDGSYRYDYDLTDHLGNVRATIQENPTTHVADTLQQDDYYPFGSRYTVNAGDNHYLYNGKEIQDEFKQYDYGARFYNPAIGRWNGVDQMAERYNSLSPYNYVMNNPIMFTDPDGRDPDCPDCKANSHTSNGESYDSSNGYTYIYQTSSKTWRRDPSMPKREPKELNEVTIKGEKYDPYNPYFTVFLDGGNDDDNAPHVPYANQGGNDQNAVDPSTVGRNYFGLVYLGPNNPKTYGNKYDYSTAPANLSDRGALAHDLGYDHYHAVGIMGVLTNTDVIGVDYTLVGHSFAVYGNPTNGADINDRSIGVLTGLGIGLAAAPKTAVYGLGQVLNFLSYLGDQGN